MFHMYYLFHFCMKLSFHPFFWNIEKAHLWVLSALNWPCLFYIEKVFSATAKKCRTEGQEYILKADELDGTIMYQIVGKYALLVFVKDLPA